MDKLEQLRDILNNPEWTEADCRFVLGYFEDKEIPELASLLTDRFKAAMLINAPGDKERAAKILAAIHARIDKPAAQIRFIHAKWWAAAAIFFLLAGGGYFLLKQNKETLPQTQQARFKNDVAPGGNKAILTLSNGEKIILDSAHNGLLAQQSGTKIIKLDSGKLSYNPSAGTGTIAFNTLATPRGGQYQLTLPDGSRVWLNAASSITYPTAFTGKERVVEMAGEVYFDVVHNAKMPFKVKAGNQTIKDIGTQFNVNAYSDEPSIKTTLVEGAIELDNMPLKPGQQAVSLNGKTTVNNNNVNMDEVVAWKEGRFNYHAAGIETVMRQVARWYDVDVTYSGKVGQVFYGTIPRSVSAENFFKVLEETGGVHFAIDGKKVTVMP